MRHAGTTYILKGKVEQGGAFACVVRLSTGHLLSLPVPGEVGDEFGATAGIYRKPKPATSKADTRGLPRRPGVKPPEWEAA